MMPGSGQISKVCKKKKKHNIAFEAVSFCEGRLHEYLPNCTRNTNNPYVHMKYV